MGTSNQYFENQLNEICSHGGHANNFRVQNVSGALVDKFTVGYDIHKIYENRFLPVINRNNMLLVGIQSEKFVKLARTRMTETLRA